MLPQTVRALRRATETTLPDRAAPLALRAPSSGRTVALSERAAQIWGLCDGRRSLFDLVSALGDTGPAEIDAFIDVTTTLHRLQASGHLELVSEALEGRPPVKFVFGVQDKTYFHWQLAIVFESLIGQLPEGWEIWVVVSNDHEALSPTLERILQEYGARHLTAVNLPSKHDMDFTGGGDNYQALNKNQALEAVAAHVGGDDLVFLLDSDNFLYRELDLTIFPRGNALCENWIIEHNPFFTHVGRNAGVDLSKVLESLGGTGAFQPGGVTLFLTGETLQNEKLRADFFRFTQVVYLLGRINGANNVWLSEMPSIALALAASGVECELLSTKSFVVTKEESIPTGTFYHYYADLKDGADGAFRHSQWCKQRFRSVDLLKTNVGRLRRGAVTDHERYFFQLAERAQRRLTGSEVRRCFVEDLVWESTPE